MQYLKEYIRENLRIAAEESFYEKGYGLSSLREIASKCDITVGNLYRYFKNKEALLDAVLRPLLTDVDQLMTELIGNELPVELRRHEQFHIRVAERLSVVCQRHVKATSILINGTEGTKYSFYFSQIMNRVALSMKQLIESQMPWVKLNPILFEVIATNQVEGILYIIKSISDPDERAEAILQFLNIHLSYFESQTIKEIDEVN